MEQEKRQTIIKLAALGSVGLTLGSEVFGLDVVTNQYSTRRKMMANKPVLMLVGTSIPTFGSSGKTEEYIDWYKKVHIPLSLKAPGMVGGTMYKVVNSKMEYPEFLTVYELESKEVVEKAMRSPEMAKAVEDGKENGPKYGMTVRWHIFYEPV